MNRLEIMKEAAREAGQFMLGAKDQTESSEKTNVKDFVTAADIKSQNIIRDGLKKHFPDAVVLSEEDSAEEQKALFAPDFTGFVLDPIDGTYNFKRDMRESAISIGYIENGESAAGVIYDPYKDELFEAEQGKGALRNGQPIYVSEQANLEGAAVAITNSYDDETMARQLKRHLGIYEQIEIMPWTSCPGSGVLVMAWIACGRIDAYHHNSVKPWDNAAAFVIAREAGAKILSLKGKEVTFITSNLIIGTPAIVEQLTTVFQKLPSELLS